MLAEGGKGLDWLVGDADVFKGGAADGYGAAVGGVLGAETAATVGGATLEGDTLEMLVPGNVEPAGKPGSEVTPNPGFAAGMVGVAARAKSP